MKYRNGFVSNSSSTSFIVTIPKSWLPSDHEIREALRSACDDGYFDEEEIKNEENTLIDSIKTTIKKLSAGEECSRDDTEGFEALTYVLPEKLILTTINSGPDDERMIGVRMTKLMEAISEN